MQYFERFLLVKILGGVNINIFDALQYKALINFITRY